MMTFSVDEMVALTTQLKRLGVEEFKYGKFAVRFGQSSEEVLLPHKSYFPPPAIERDLPLSDEDEAYTEEDLLASAN